MDKPSTASEASSGYQRREPSGTPTGVVAPSGAPRASRLVLVGYRGTGKSTVGRMVAEKLGWTFVDCDEEIEKSSGRSIAEIFAQEGESGFREREAAVLQRVCQNKHSVIATGGGVVLREDNRRLLRQEGWVVWLRAEPETILQRLQQDPTTPGRRPALTTQGGLMEICTLLVQRDPLYAAVADWVVDTDQRTPAVVAAAILAAFVDQQRSV